MQTRIIRPDLREQDLFQITLDGDMLSWIEDGMVQKIADIYVSLDGHAECDLRNETGCVVREKWLIGQYGDLLTARTAGHFPSDCTEDLAYLHAEMGKLMDALRQARWLRNNPHSRGLYERNDAETQLLAIKGEVAAREVAGTVQTGPMPILDDETLAALDKKRLDEAAREGTLLGLDSPTNATTKTAVAKPAAKAKTSTE